MAERSTAAVDVAETSGMNGTPLPARLGGATSDGATDATNGHSRGTGAPAPAAPTPIPSGTAFAALSRDAGDSTPPDETSAQDPAGAGAGHSSGKTVGPEDGSSAHTGPKSTTTATPTPAAPRADNPAGKDRPADDSTDTADATGASGDEDGEEGGGAGDSAPKNGRAAEQPGPEKPDAEKDSAAKDSSEKPDPEQSGAKKGGKDDAANGSTPAGTSPETSGTASASETDGDTDNETDSGTDGDTDRNDADSDSAGASGKSSADEEAGSRKDSGKSAAPAAAVELRVPELHSGHKLARRYRLEECVTRLDGFSSWRAVDEKLRRAVGVHILPAGHSRARQVLSAARSAALLGDPRFVQVLDAVEEDDLVYVVHEWLPDAVPLSEVLTTRPLEAHEAYQLVGQLSQALAAAHREGLAHLRLNPTCVLRTGMGQYRIRGLAVNAALRGVTSENPQRDDTEAIGALLYAALTQRWPYEEDAHGLPGVGSLDMSTLAAPEQVRAGVHRGLSTLAMRALVNDGATASRQEQPCTTPDELAKAVSALPRIRPPEQAFPVPPPFPRAAYQQGAAQGAGGAAGRAATAPRAEPPTPPTLPGRTGKVLKWGVSALLIAALGLGSWQIADALLSSDTPEKKTTKNVQAHDTSAHDTGKPIKIEDIKDFDPQGDGSENPDKVGDAIDGKPGTYWLTSKYIGHADFGNLKSGAGLILDLGKARQVSSLKVDFIGKTSVSFLAAPSSVTSMPTSLGSFSKVTSGSGEHVTLKAKKPIKTRFVLVWLTKLPLSEDGNYRGRVTEVQVLS
ncbi:hypothetical protein TPA0909_47010 [Streptomyces albus]|nr:hypothetical protein TPA0909_47010 [Streptomyces albus]